MEWKRGFPRNHSSLPKEKISIFMVSIGDEAWKVAKKKVGGFPNFFKVDFEMSEKSEMSRTPTALRELYWKTLILGSHFPQDFDGGRFQSVPGDQFPIDIVLGLDKIGNIYKIVVDVGDEMIPSQITIRIGKGDPSKEVNYKNARLAKFTKPVVMKYFKRERSMSRMESKSAFTDSIGQYIWLTIGKSLNHALNPNELVEIKGLKVLGYPMPEEQTTENTETFSKSPESGKLENLEKAEEKKKFEYPKNETKVERESYEGDGMSMTSSEDKTLSGDPLSSVRTIRRILEQKMGEAQEEGKTIQATVCLRAIQRIDEYETRIEELSTRRSRALQAGDVNLAERHRLAMIDCRDTVFRAVHIDLLLDRSELRAIGVQSEWADE